MVNQQGQVIRAYESDCTKDFLELICDIAVDYDGYTTVNGLKDLIDEMAEYAKQALICLNKGEITHYEKSGE